MGGPLHASVEDDTLVVRTGREAPLSIPLVWLRAHCPCPRCLHPQTRQRLVDSFALDPELRPASLATSEDGHSLELCWDDGHVSRYPRALFDELREAEPPPPRTSWLAADARAAMRPFAHDEVLADDTALQAWLEHIERYGFAFVAGVPRSVEATGRLAHRIGYIRRSIFGGLWSFTDDLEHGDTAYTNGEVGLHTDGTYCHDAPGLQMLHCLEFEGTGAESRLVDGLRAAQELRRREPAAFELLTRVEIPGRYLEPGVHLRAARPALRSDARGRVIQVSFNDGDRAPLLLAPDPTRRLFSALRSFHTLVNTPAAALRFVLEPGTALIFDNWRVLHGRGAYTGVRELCGCYLNREDFESRLRVLRAAHSPT